MNFNLIVYLCSTPPQHQDETGRKLKIFKDTDQRVGVRSEILPIFVAPGWNLSGAPPGTSAAGSRGHFGNNAQCWMSQWWRCGPGCLYWSPVTAQQTLARWWNVIESRIMRTLHADHSSAPTLCKAKSRNCKWKLLMTEEIADREWLLAWGKFSVHLFE